MEQEKETRREFCRQFCEEELELNSNDAIPKRVQVTCYLIDVVNEAGMKASFIEKFVKAVQDTVT